MSRKHPFFHVYPLGAFQPRARGPFGLGMCLHGEIDTAIADAAAGLPTPDQAAARTAEEAAAIKAQEDAAIQAEMDAKARLVRFMNEGIGSNNYSQTITKNVEKAQDRIKNRIRADEEVEMSDQDAAKDTNYAVRENTNETVRTLSESIRNNAEGKLKGAMLKEADIVDRQTVRVVIRWDKDSERASSYMRKRFGVQ